jgi:hypothetical protein
VRLDGGWYDARVAPFRERELVIIGEPSAAA